MTMYAHYNKETGEKQHLDNHIRNVAENMITELKSLNFPGISQERLQEILFKVGLYHDIGKAMRSFQDYLETGKGGMEKNHAFISAAIFSTFHEKNDLLAYTAFLSIVKHHSSINSEVKSNTHDFQQLVSQYQDCYTQLNKEHVEEINLSGDQLDLKQLEEFINSKTYYISKRRASEVAFFLLQYIFSKLIWADKLDSAHINFISETKKSSLLDVENCLQQKQQEKQEQHKQKELALNDKRTRVKQAVLGKVDSLTDQEIQESRIFSLTAPTGTGKTLTSVSAALKISERIEKLYGYKPRIITALPFINILEQTKTDYEEIFDHVMVHSSANVYESKLPQDETIPLKDRLLLTSAWESPVIITTFVQFFESVLGSQNSWLIKLNKMAGSIVILDEIQALPGKYYPLLGAVIYHLAEYYGTRFILMTATQPEIVASANKILKNKAMNAIELLEDSAEYYAELKRTRLIPAFDQVKDNESLVSFVNQTRGEKQSAVVVVNTIAQSIEVYNLLKETNRVLYLSTNLVSKDRKKVIDEAKQLLENKTPFILVSTQTIEAGVDLDFDIGYRDLGPLESIVQIAGRVNRSGGKDDFSPVYIFDTGTGKSVYKNYHLKQTRDLLKQEILENEYADLIQKYYKILLADQSYDKTIYEAIEKLDYDTIEQFQLIEDQQDVKTVLVILDDEIEKLVDEYCQLIKKGKLDFNNKAKLSQLLRIMSQYTVDVRIKKLIKNRPCTFHEVYGVHLDWFVVQQADLKYYYDKTGFISESKEAFLY